MLSWNSLYPEYHDFIFSKNDFIFLQLTHKLTGAMSGTVRGEKLMKTNVGLIEQANMASVLNGLF